LAIQTCVIDLGSQECHPPSYHPPPCPFSPSVIQTCPCPNATPLTSLTTTPRTECSDPIPTCGKICARERDDCGHLCTIKCHEGACPRCEVTIEERCRCGKLGRKRKCWEVKERVPVSSGVSDDTSETNGIFTCDKKCLATRNCGKHVCGRICCPLAALAGVGENIKGKRKQKEGPTAAELRELDPEGWHVCDLVCNA
jgi:transcriptional repressor NF-X1